MLAALLKGSEKQDAKEVLDINLFPEPIKKSGGGGGAGQAADDYEADVIVFETNSTQQQERIKNLVGDWDTKASSQKKEQDEADDLLDLMDSAT